MTLPRTVELQWQKEMICRWLDSRGLPEDVRSGLLEMLNNVQTEIENPPTDPLQCQDVDVPAKNI